jgi:hypothetical protein
LVRVIDDLHRVVDSGRVPRERAGTGLILDAVPDAAAKLIELTDGAARGRTGAVAGRVGVVGVEGDLGDVPNAVLVAEIAIHSNVRRGHRPLAWPK